MRHSFGASNLLHTNPFLAALAGSATLATLAPSMCAAFEPLGEAAAELMKFFALLEAHLLADLPAGGYLVAVLALLLARRLLTTADVNR